MNAPLYTTEILRLAASLPDPRTLEREDGAAELRSPTCGSTMRTAVQIDEAGRIAGISQQVQACAFGQASAALLDKHVTGRTRSDVAIALNAQEHWLGGTGPGPDWVPVEPLAPARSKAGRHGAILLPLRTLLAAMDASR